MASFEQPGTVSLWLFREPENPSDVDKDVLQEFCGVDYYDSDSTEGVVREAPTAAASLIKPLSYSASFLDVAVAAAVRLGVTEAYGVLAQYDFAYDPTQVERPV